MLTRTKRWLDRRERASAGRPVVRIDDVEIMARQDGRGADVVIHGVNLHRAITPPHVTIDGEPLLEMEFSQDGRAIRGRMPGTPRGGEAVVDYGFTRAARSRR